jgi:N-methylhydantoinase B
VAIASPSSLSAGFLRHNAPNNSGFFRAILVKAPAGSLVNPNPPAAVAARGISGFRLIDAMFGALAQAIPERVRAAGEGGTTSYSFGCYDTDGRFSLFREAVMGAWGGGYRRDGIDGIANGAANISNAPIEMVENQAAIRVEHYELVPDSGGPGEWRGGCPCRGSCVSSGRARRCNCVRIAAVICPTA